MMLIEVLEIKEGKGKQRKGQLSDHHEFKER